jgi:hypothetical protein
VLHRALSQLPFGTSHDVAPRPSELDAPHPPGAKSLCWGIFRGLRTVEAPRIKQFARTLRKLVPYR